VALYEEAVQMLQRHDFAKAAETLRTFLTSFPEERELVERSRMYLALCERQLAPALAHPQNTAERLYAATLALNGRQLDLARAYLERILQDQPAHDQALYMLAVTHAQRAQTADAIRYLQKAIEANPENRAFARTDPDLDGVRRDAGVAALLDPAISRASDPRREPRR
jgi:tetratricopeptide (TPR) repeat protein